METIGIVADVGGTNIRLAQVNLSSGKTGTIRSYHCIDYPTLVDVVREYRKQTSEGSIHACIAVACPVEDDWISLTNNQWSFSLEQTRSELGFKSLYVINDYTAIAMAIPRLKATQKHQIGRGEAVPGKPIAVCGPGTGLGVSFLIEHEGQWVCLEGEGGHVDFAPQSDIEDFILEHLRSSYSHVSAERLISGPGLVNLYQGIKMYYDEFPEDLEPREITRRAVAGEDSRCREVLDLFCRLLGAFAGNLAITAWAAGGVYIGGGIAPQLVNHIAESNFRAMFEAKGRFTQSMKKIPTYIITEDHPGITGAAAYLTQKAGVS